MSALPQTPRRWHQAPAWQLPQANSKYVSAHRCPQQRLHRPCKACGCCQSASVPNLRATRTPPRAETPEPWDRSSRHFHGLHAHRWEQ